MLSAPTAEAEEYSHAGCSHCSSHTGCGQFVGFSQDQLHSTGAQRIEPHSKWEEG